MKAVLRSARAAPQSLVCAAHHRAAPLKFAWHYHAQYELVLILSGRGSRQVGTCFEDFTKYDLVLMGAGLPHRYASRSITGASGNACEFIVVHFDPALFPVELGRDPTLAPLWSLLSRASQGVSFGVQSARAVAPLLMQLPDARPMQRWATLLNLLEQLVDAADTTTLCPVSYLKGQLNADRDDPISRSCAFVEKNLVRPMSVHEAAAAAGMSLSAFSRSFRKATGLSFVSYVNELRLGVACLLLTEGDRPVKAIAAAAGFPNRSYFHRTFVSRKGMTPAEYRQQSGVHTSKLLTTPPATSVRR